MANGSTIYNDVFPSVFSSPKHQITKKFAKQSRAFEEGKETGLRFANQEKTTFESSAE